MKISDGECIAEIDTGSDDYLKTKSNFQNIENKIRNYHAENITWLKAIANKKLYTEGPFITNVKIVNHNIDL